MPATDIDLRERSPLALAYVGDGVLDLLVRAKLVAESRLAPGALHHRAVEVVSARAQAESLRALEPMLTEREQEVVKWGRNASKATVSKHATPEQYRASTGLETLLGWLYLSGNSARVGEVFEAIWQRYLALREEG